MRLDFTIDDAALQAKFRRFPTEAGGAFRRGVQRFSTRFTADFTRKQLSAPDDRVAIPALGGLGIRPRGSRGLVRRSGSLARALITRTRGNTIADVEGKIGFLDPRSAMIARVQERGATIRGRPFLIVPVRGLGAALGASTGLAFLRKATIPPRLGFFDAFDREKKKVLPDIRIEMQKVVGRRG